MSRPHLHPMRDLLIDAPAPTVGDTLASNLRSRDELHCQLLEEVVGPGSSGKPLVGRRDFESWQAARGPFRADDGEEILTSAPSRQYAAGVLHPAVAPTEEIDDALPEATPEEAEAGETQPDDAAHTVPAAPDAEADAGDEDEGDSEEKISASEIRPCAMGLSFLLRRSSTARLRLCITGGRYTALPVKIAEAQHKFWRRHSVQLEHVTSVPALAASMPGVEGRSVHRLNDLPLQGPASATAESAAGDGPRLQLSCVIRRDDARFGSDTLLVTASVVNRSSGDGHREAEAFFQARLTIQTEDEKGQPLPAIAPYPRLEEQAQDEEEASIALLYRDANTFAIGHGTSAEWESPAAEATTTHRVSTQPMPAWELPSISPDVRVTDASGRKVPLAIAMRDLIGERATITAALQRLTEAYGAWIEEQQARVATLPEAMRPAALRHLETCGRAQKRMQEGLEFLSDARDKQSRVALEAFRLMNLAMFIQQERAGSRETRTLRKDKNALLFDVPMVPFDPKKEAASGRGRWRAFQIAFLLMSLRSVALRDDADREQLELIWFPTGGGKTEAYLGLAAFSILYRRLWALQSAAKKDPTTTTLWQRENVGIDVMMRYTLRLLTAQQFQRAAALFCALEYLRRHPNTSHWDLPEAHRTLGETPFLLGMWLGRSTAPNTRADARKALKALGQNGPLPSTNITVLERCPWCRAQLGRVKTGQQSVIVAGLREGPLPGSTASTVLVHCSDQTCLFRNDLPVRFIDEDLYDRQLVPPSMVIGTADKFAMLAYKPEARRLFGVGADGQREVWPPNLILQDELHLIAGPLGSLFGLYEAVIERFCSLEDEDAPDGLRRPKIVASTATIRSYREQARRLFGRQRIELFPPPGIDAGDSFFAAYARDEEGRLQPGRRYVGLFAPGYGSTQTAQVRTFSTLAQAPMLLPPEADKDPWWTLLAFYNSIRELGGAQTLYQTDIPERLKTVHQRLGFGTGDKRRRFITNARELNSNKGAGEVLGTMADLERVWKADGKKIIDVCLASNIIEVGVDIDRLSLMAVVGQPKSTSQYIQVTGRVGRRPGERPGLILTIYGVGKPRDRSHFEQFRSYHQRLFAQVEPLSVTPFSGPSVERALPGVLATFLRQTAAPDELPSVIPLDRKNEFRSLVEERMKRAGASQEALDGFHRQLDQIYLSWENGNPQFWESKPPSLGLIPSMQEMMAGLPSQAVMRPLTSLRSVDESADPRRAIEYQS